MADGFMQQPEVQETEPADDFLPEWAVPEVAAPQTENFMPEMKVPGWDMAESVFASRSRSRQQKQQEVTG